MSRKKYNLVGVDGNAFAIMGYVRKALQETGHNDLIKKYTTEAMSSDYDNLLRVSLKYVDIANGEGEIK